VLICLYTGALRATVTGPKGDLQDFDLLPFNTDADNNSDVLVLKFLPRCEGIDVGLAGQHLVTSCCFYIVTYCEVLEVYNSMHSYP